MTREIDIAALRKAAQEGISFADARVPGWEQDAAKGETPRLVIAVPVPAHELVALLDRLEQAEKDAALLDWLVESGLVVDQGHKGWFILDGEVYVADGHKTARDAISAAMQGEGA